MHSDARNGRQDRNDKNHKIMWQRIQSLYLAVATALLTSMFFCKFATILGPDGVEISIKYFEKVPYLVLLAVALAGNVFSLFAFKIRIPQMRVATVAALILLAFQIWIIVDVVRGWNEMVFSVTALFPLVAMVLDILAARNIMLDEAMVQSASRLRASKRRRK